MPPGVPADRVAAVKSAFAAALKDPLLIGEAKKQSIDITYRSPDDLLTLIHAMYATPKAQLDRAAELIPASSD